MPISGLDVLFSTGMLGFMLVFAKNLGGHTVDLLEELVELGYGA